MNIPPPILPAGNPQIHLHHHHEPHDSAPAVETTVVGDVPAISGQTSVPIPVTAGQTIPDSSLPSFAEATSGPVDNHNTDVSQQPGSVSPVRGPILDSRVVIRIGEKQFFTTRATLAESQLLTVLLNNEDPPEGEYFLDADQETFTHILCFLRTRRFPLFYDQTTGHDPIKYTELLAAARFFQIPSLVGWLDANRYLDAIAVRSDYKAYSLYGNDQISRMHELCWAKNEKGRILTISEKESKVHACPARLWRHDGDRRKCFTAGCLLNVTLRNVDTSKNMRVLDVTALVTRTEIREAVLSAGNYLEGPPPYQGGAEDD